MTHYNQQYRKKILVKLDPSVVNYCESNAVPYVRISSAGAGFISLVNPSTDPLTINDRIPMAGYEFDHVCQGKDGEDLAMLKCPINCDLQITV